MFLMSEVPLCRDIPVQCAYPSGVRGRLSPSAADRRGLKKNYRLLPASQGQNRALAVLFVPSSLDSGFSPRSEPALSAVENRVMGTSLIRKRLPLGPYGRPIPRAL